MGIYIIMGGMALFVTVTGVMDLIARWPLASLARDAPGVANSPTEPGLFAT